MSIISDHLSTVLGLPKVPAKTRKPDRAVDLTGSVDRVEALTCPACYTHHYGAEHVTLKKHEQDIADMLSAEGHGHEDIARVLEYASDWGTVECLDGVITPLEKIAVEAMIPAARENEWARHDHWGWTASRIDLMA